MEKTCAQCGAEFHTRESRRKFCSPACYNQSHEKHNSLYRRQTRTCVVCGKEFEFRWQGRSAHKGLYCSRVCSSTGRKGQVPDQLGEKHWNWKGGRHVRKRDGYAVIRVRDETGRGKPVLEHRYVMEQHLGRELGSHETIHHRNGQKDDNRLENLELRVGNHGRGATHAHCPTCTCFEE
jgi:hypothetical protein